MLTRLAVLGATGSIGRQTLDVAASHPDRLRVTGLSCRSNAEGCSDLARTHGARVVVLERDGEAAIVDLARAADVDLVVVAVPGIAAVRPTLAALQAGKSVAIAAKEVLVVAGHLVQELVPEGAGERLRPVDSEHSALWQCLRGEERETVESVTLTASGGPFRGLPLPQLARVTVEAALRHPIWRMGPKVTIDSATLVNKGYEVIEAHWLFDLAYGSISAVVHPESVLHALVQFRDGSAKAQLAYPDMRLPIQYALLYPDRPRTAMAAPRFDATALNFEPIEAARYPCYGLVLEAARRGAAATIAVNAADELAVERFLHGAISFTDIAELLERALELASRSGVDREPDLETILAFDAEIRRSLAAPAVA